MPFPQSLTNAQPGVTEIKAEHLNNLEAKVGIDGSTVPTSLDYLLKNTASVNPGHKHTVSAIQGLQATVNELNCLIGMDRNIYDEFELCLRVNRLNVATVVEIVDAYNEDGVPIANYGSAIRVFYDVEDDVTISSLTGVFLTGRLHKDCDKDVLYLRGALISGVHHGTGVIDTLVGLSVWTNMYEMGGSVNTGICLHVGPPARNYKDTDKTYVDTYGIYISPQKRDYITGKVWAIYQGGVDDVNQLNGNTGIGTDSFGTNARRVLALRDGVAPESSPANVVQLWANDRGGVNGKVGLHIRCEDGTQHVFADRTGIGTLTPAMFMDVSLPAVGSTSCFAVSSATASSYRTYLAALDGDRYAWLTNVRYTGSAYVKDNTNRGSWGVVHGCPTSDSAAACTINYFPVESTTPHVVLTVTGAGNVGVGQSSFGAAAVKVLAIGSGTAPTSSPADAVQIWAADRGGAAGKAGLHLRCEDGTQHVLSDRTGIGTVSPSAFVEIALPEVDGASCLAIKSATATTFKTYLAANSASQYAWLTNARYDGTDFAKDDSGRGAWRLGQVCGEADADSRTAIDYLPVGSGNPSTLLLVTGAGNVGIGQTMFGTSAVKVLALGSGTAPSSSPADAVQIYCADQAAGNACLHARTENGAVIKLYQESALTAALTTITHTEPGTQDYAIQDLTNSGGYGFATKDEGNTVLKVIANLQTRIAELESRLQNLGLLAS